MLHVSHTYTTLCLLLFIIFSRCRVILSSERIERASAACAWVRDTRNFQQITSVLPPPHTILLPCTRIKSKMWYVCSFNLFWNAIRRLLVYYDNVTCACRPEVYFKSLSGRNKTWNNFTHTHAHIQWLYFDVYVLKYCHVVDWRFDAGSEVFSKNFTDR